MLAENTDRPEAMDSARRQAIFLSLWGEIREAYAKGWSYIDIWRALERDGIVDFGYSTFLHYIRKMKRRHQEVAREVVPGVKETTVVVAPSPAPLDKPPASPPGPITAKVELPLFGQGATPRDPKRF